MNAFHHFFANISHFRRVPNIKRSDFHFENEKSNLLDNLQNLNQSIAFNTMPEQHEKTNNKLLLQRLSNPSDSLLQQHNNHTVFYNNLNPEPATSKTDNKPVAIKTKSNKPDLPIINSKKQQQKTNNNALAEKLKKTANVLARSFILMNLFFYLSTDVIYLLFLGINEKACVGCSYS